MSYARPERDRLTQVCARIRWMDRCRALLEQEAARAERIGAMIEKSNQEFERDVRRLEEFVAVHGDEPPGAAEQLELAEIVDRILEYVEIDDSVLRRAFLRQLRPSHLPRAPIYKAAAALGVPAPPCL